MLAAVPQPQRRCATLGESIERRFDHHQEKPRISAALGAKQRHLLRNVSSGRRTPQDHGRRVHKVLNRRGTLWQNESYDHLIRDDLEFVRAVEYLVNNPVTAGLVGSGSMGEADRARRRDSRATLACLRCGKKG